MRLFLCEHLQNHYRVLEAEDGARGLARACETVPDLVICDVMMPVMDGIETCRRLKTDEKTNHIPVILLTARASQKNQIKGLETDADDYIVKPFQTDVLLSRVANLLRNRQKLREKFRREMVLKPEELPLPSSDQVFLKKAMSMVEKFLQSERFGVYELAEEMGFSRRQLNRKMTALTGMHPGDFIRQIRLEKAAQMLRQRVGNVSEIAYAVGFKKPKHFSALFRRTFGETPSSYADKNGGETGVHP